MIKSVFQNKNPIPAILGKYAGWILFILSTLYLIAELIFNVRMLDVSGTSLSKPDAFEDIQFFGRLVSASGFTLLVLEICRKFECRFQTGFRQTILGIIILICLLPFFLSFGSILLNTFAGQPVPRSAFDSEMIWSFVPIIGLCLLLISRAERPALTLAGIVIMAWPAMFFGQKLLVERFIIEPTSWQDRLNAQYILMLRAGAEECIFSLDDLDLCDASKKDAELRSVNAVFGAMVMNAPEHIINDILEQKDKAIYAVARQESLNNIDRAYKAYLLSAGFYQEVLREESRQKNKEFSKLVYKYYKAASDAYEEKTSTKSINKIADQIWSNIESGINKAWRTYQSAIIDYDRALNSMAQSIRQRIIAFQRRYVQCRKSGGNCERIKETLVEALRKKFPHHIARIESLCRYNVLKTDCGITIDYLKQIIRKRTDNEFIKQSGYSPFLTQKSDFMLSLRTQNLIKTLSYAKIKQNLEAQGLVMTQPLPPVMTKDSIRSFITSVIKENADHQWHEQTIKTLGVKIPPGLNEAEFLKLLLTQKRLVPLKNTPMTKDHFFENMILPKYKAEVVARYDKIQAEAADYANGKKLEEKGKSFIRAVYIPPIALGLSLVISVITLGKNMLFILLHILGPCLLWIGVSNPMGKIRRLYIYAGFWLVYAVGTGYFLHSYSNPYVETLAYKKYHDAAYDRAPVMTMAIDGIVRAQPSIYIAGRAIEDLFEKLE